jgi:thiol-disulfide isomerase/thioredoxin
MIKEADQPYTLINFFATWCKPCIQELPDLVALHNDPQSKIQVILISIDSPDVAEGKLHSFVADNGIDFQTYAVTEKVGAFVAQFYTIWNERIPLSLLYSKSGRMVEALEGVTDRAEIELIVNMHEKLGS